ncbi:hypothetical protein GQ42DRAFT_52872 [Ramicandelaber brevisporus]|nr:hypothetical protein GQ42DRAFT_52872 [Ramicandelaber brevisporus]
MEMQPVPVEPAPTSSIGFIDEVLREIGLHSGKTSEASSLPYISVFPSTPPRQFQLLPSLNRAQTEDRSAARKIILPMEAVASSLNSSNLGRIQARTIANTVYDDISGHTMMHTSRSGSPVSDLDYSTCSQSPSPLSMQPISMHPDLQTSSLESAHVHHTPNQCGSYTRYYPEFCLQHLRGVCNNDHTTCSYAHSLRNVVQASRARFYKRGTCPTRGESFIPAIEPSTPEDCLECTARGSKCDYNHGEPPFYCCSQRAARILFGHRNRCLSVDILQNIIDGKENDSPAVVNAAEFLLRELLDRTSISLELWIKSTQNQRTGHPRQLAKSFNDRIIEDTREYVNGFARILLEQD